ncbi:MAG: hypothetical protein JZU47_01495 [Prolixibacteraceae bacterium]|nr:hypothetical protein [Prolixibacteraceae bacterium]
MTSSLHTIRKQVVQFQYNGNADGFALQKELSEWCNFNLIPAIEQQLDSFDLGENYFTIDKLKIEATANKNDWQQKIRDELIFSLKQKLIDYKPKFKEESGNKREKRARKLDELIIYYFENGYLPWWEKALVEDDFEAVLLNWICDEMSPDRAKIVSERLKQTDSNNQILRIINLVPQKFIFTFLKNIYKQETELISQTESFFKDLSANNNLTANKSDIIKKVNSFLLMILIDSEGIMNIDLMLQFLYDEVKSMKGLAKMLEPASVKIVGETNPVKLAWKKLLTAKKKEKRLSDHKDVFQYQQITNLKDTEQRNEMPENPIQDQIQEDFEILTISEKEKTLQYNKLIDRLTNPDSANKNQDNLVTELQEGIYIDNAGAVILAAFLPALFKQLELENDGVLQNPDLAAMLIQYCTTGKAIVAEYELVLPKLLCGIDIEFPVNTNTKITTEQMKEADEMLLALIEHWSVLKNTSIDGLRESFLKRSGKLSIENNNWLLQIEQRPYDMLLQQLPWGVSMIKLPWMNMLLLTEWV